MWTVTTVVEFHLLLNHVFLLLPLIYEIQVGVCCERPVAVAMDACRTGWTVSMSEYSCLMKTRVHLRCVAQSSYGRA